MNENVTKVLFACLASSLKDEKLSGNEKKVCTEEVVHGLVAIAKKHDISQLMYKSLTENGLVLDSDSNYRNSLFKTIFRYENQNCELNRIRALLEKNEIPFIVLKGSVIRNYYNEPWLRTSCDIDILVQKENIEKASDMIVEELKYERAYVSTHDVSLMSPSKVHLELHFELKETDFKESKLLSNIWDGTELVEGSNYEKAMTSEMFLFFHIYHMAKHFKYGGCGIKPLVDLWIIKNKMGYDEKKALTLLEREGFDKFYKNALLLSNVWFENASHNDVTRSMERFVIHGGVFGTAEQNLAMEQGSRGGALQRMFFRVFMPYSQLKKSYKVLQKCPILYPAFTVVRWFRIVFGGGKKRAINEIKNNQSVTQAERNTAKSLIDELGL